MSVRALAGVWKYSAAATATEIAVLTALADWADEYGYCYPSYASIAEKARVSERQVQRVIRKFVANGELERQVGGHIQSAPGHRPGKTGLQPRNLYRLTCVPDEQPRGDSVAPLVDDRRGDATAPLSHVEGVTPGRERGDTSDRKGVTGTTAHIRKNRQEEPSGDTSGRRVAFQGVRFAVPKFLHEQFADQLGPKGLAAFDLLAWYGQLDARSDGPIVGDVLSFIRQAFAADTKRRFGSRAIGDRLAYADWICPHTPHCNHPTRCQQLIALDAEKQRSA